MTSAVAAELREVVAALARSHANRAGQLPALWPELLSGGLAAVAIPETAGGSGGELADLVAVVGELGRAGVSSPVIEANTGWLLLASTAQTLPVVGFGAELHEGVLRARVPWARHASTVLVHVEGAGWLQVEPADAAVTEQDNIAGEPRDLVLATAYRPVTGPELRGRVNLLWAAAVAGAADTAFRLTREYVTARVQFGKPLVAIPAVQAGLARMRVALNQADVAVQRATAVAENEDALRFAAAAARVTCAQSATEIARLAHQLHGAIGVTAEFGLGRYTTRLMSWRDTVTTERDAARQLGAAARAGGETVMWERLLS